MQPDEELCLCFHVTRRKVASYLRVEQPQRVAQLADCYGAGTGCGWCRPFLKQMFEAHQAGQTAEVDLPAVDDYADRRSQYVHKGGGTPPAGATPINPADDTPADG